MADLLWRNATTGANELWLMNGTNVVSDLSLGNVPGTWSVAGLGDFNADGMADILWRNAATGADEIWEMDGNTVTWDAIIGAVPAS